METVIALGIFEALTTRQKIGIGAGVGGVGAAGLYGYNIFRKGEQLKATRASDSAMGDLDSGRTSKFAPKYYKPEAPPARQVGGANISGLKRAEANIPKPDNLNPVERMIRKGLQTKLDLGTKIIGNIAGQNT